MDKFLRELEAAWQSRNSAKRVSRVPALDGLRGIAALAVVFFHYLCMLHIRYVPEFADGPVALVAYTPLAIFWDGRYAVLIFFILSGFVIAASAERRGDDLFVNVIARYFRLAIPAAASLILALGLLSLFPTAATDLAASLPTPSRWLGYTIQGELPSFLAVLYRGMIGNFVTGDSVLNNVLWTMQIELIGSIAVFFVFWAARGNVVLRLAGLAGFALLALILKEYVYLCFVSGALLFEAYRLHILRLLPPWTAIAALVVSLLLSGYGNGYGATLDLRGVMYTFRPGNPWGFIPIGAATLMMFAALRSVAFASVLSTALPQWLGRISFGLYLVHVPILYTIVAWMRLNTEVPGIVLFAGFIALALAAAQLFTLLVDEPSLRMIGRVRKRARGPTPAQASLSEPLSRRP